MFENYLINKKEYDELEDFITTEFNNNVADKLWYSPYYNVRFANGTKFYDANPIFSAQHFKKKLIVKIILDEYSDGIVEMIDYVEDDKIYIFSFNIVNLRKGLIFIFNKINGI